MKKTLSFVVLLGCAWPAFPQVDKLALVNEERQVRFAEQVVMNQFVLGLSPSYRQAKEKCLQACEETGALELAIGLIGMSKGRVGSDALVNLLGIRLDGAGSEEVTCQILTRGRPLLHRLQSSKPANVAAQCRKNFADAKKRQLAQVLDVQVEQVCRSESEIANVRDELAKAIASKIGCEL